MATKTSYSHARQNLAKLWDEVEDSREAAFEAVERGLAHLKGIGGDTGMLESLARYSVERLH